jgi:hypothetical protein
MTRRSWARAGIVIGGLLALASPLLAQRTYIPPSRNQQAVWGNVPYDGKFVFIRMAYPWGGRQGAPWSHDYPVGEQNFLKILTAVSNINAHVERTSVMTFGDPEVFKFPVMYLVEPGYWELSMDDAKSLRNYLLKGGFLIVDDFPSWAWGTFDLQITKAFPEGRWIELAPDASGAGHPIFHTFFEILSVPQSYPLGGPPRFLALFEDNDPKKRMLAIANYCNDLSEFWEASNTGYYIVENSNEAYKIGVNQFIYGVTR